MASTEGGEIRYDEVFFVGSFYAIGQLPHPGLPEIAFAGRSNVGKSSLINCLTGRRNLVKTSAKPGKTKSLNFFQVGDSCYLVDLPGYGFAEVSRQTRLGWRELITGYLLERPSLACVVVIIDLRHELKVLDRELLEWLAANGIASLVVYTKADKLSGNVRSRNAAALDAALGLVRERRVLFSSKTGEGRREMNDALAKIVTKR